MQVQIPDLEPPARLTIESAVPLTDEAYFAFCVANPEARIERTAEGEILIMAPTGGETSSRNVEILFQLQAWAKRDGRGKVFDSNGEFFLPNGAARSPDAAWVSRERLSALSAEEKKRFPPVCPEFVIELQSPSDRRKVLAAKMEEWVKNGADLGWLIDPDQRTVAIYRPNRPPEFLTDPVQVTGEGPVAGFVLTLAPVWETL